MSMPFLDLKAQFESMRERIEDKIREVVDSQWFIGGPEVAGLESELAAYSGTSHAVGVSSGTDALLASLMALEVGPDDAVLLPAFTFFATAGVVARLGARPVFCDIDPATFNISPPGVEELLERDRRGEGRTRIKAVLPVHLYGQVADMDSLMDATGRFDCPVIEDAAQAVGAEYLGKNGVARAGSLGMMGTLSFFPSKNLGGYGDGGMILTNDGKLADRLKMMRNHGAVDRYHHRFVGGNFRLDALQAAVLRIKLDFLDDWLKARRERARFYNRLFEESGLIKSGDVGIPVEAQGEMGLDFPHTYHQYVIRTRKRDDLQSYLTGREIPSVIYYPLGLHRQECFSDLGYQAQDFPETERATAEVLALPIYPEIPRGTQERVVSGIADFFGSR